VIVIPFLMLYPSYDVKTLHSGVYATTNLSIEEVRASQEVEEILFYEESLYQSVMVTSTESGEKLRLNGKIQCTMSPLDHAGIVNLGFLPFNLYEYNYGTPQTALNVGLGCGITSKALSEHLKTTTIEIDPVVVEANVFFNEPIDHRLIIDDARNWLLRNDEKFDIIVTEPSDPYHNNGMLYTKEYFSLLSDRLTENGLVSQWVPAWELPDDNFMIFYNTFHSVFPYVYVYYMVPDNFSQLIFIGSQKSIEVTIDELYLFNHKDLREVETELNTDDKPIIEFATALSLYERNIIQIPVQESVVGP